MTAPITLYDVAALSDGLMPLAVEAPTATAILQIESDAAATLKALVQQGTPATTARALRTALRYWRCWHWAVYGEELPLLTEPRAVVPGDRVLVFIAHHAAVLQGAHVRDGMPVWVRERMQAIAAAANAAPVIGARRVHTRGTRLVIEEGVPALKTLQQRVQLLSMLQTRAGLPSHTQQDGRIGTVLRQVARATREKVTAALPQPAAPVGADTLAHLIAALPDDANAVRDRALLLVTWFAGGRRRAEVLDAWIEEFRLDDQPPVWLLPRAKGKRAERADGVVAQIPLPAAVASALKEWVVVLRKHGYEKGPVWRRWAGQRGRPPKTPLPDDQRPEPRLGSVLPHEYLNALLDTLADRAGVDRDQLSAHSLRSGYATEMLDAGVDLADVMRMTLHTSVQQAMKYDRRKQAHAATDAGEALAKKLFSVSTKKD